MEVIPIQEMGEIAPGDDLAQMISTALDKSNCPLGKQNIIVVTQKIVSKAYGRFASLTDERPGAEARELAKTTGKDPRLVEIVLRESSAVVRAAPGILITRHHSGHVMANAGIDRSNLGTASDNLVLLLPQDCDAIAEKLAHDLAKLRVCSPPALVISDSFGRPWRNGVTNVALGTSGLPALIDQRGAMDRDGRLMQVTQIGFADLVACAAGLVMGEAAEGTPVAVVRGLAWMQAAKPAAALIRSVEEDLFR